MANLRAVAAAWLSSRPDQATLVRLSCELIEGLLPLPLGVRLLGLTLSNLEAGSETVGQQLWLAL